MIRDKYMCSIHGYAYLPDDPELYVVENPPPIDKTILCSECSDIMHKFQSDYPVHKGQKIHFNVTDDMTQKKLMLGRYTYLRYVKDDKS